MHNQRLWDTEWDDVWRSLPRSETAGTDGDKEASPEPRQEGRMLKNLILIYFNYAFNSKPGNWGLTFQRLDLIGTCWGTRCGFLIMSTKYSPDRCSSVIHHYQAACVLSLSWKPLKVKKQEKDAPCEDKNYFTASVSVWISWCWIMHVKLHVISCFSSSYVSHLEQM